MKQMLLIIHLIILTGFGVIAQNKAGLLVRNYSNNNSKFISEGTRIHVVKDGRTYKGTLKVISDQIILVNSDTIAVSQIQELFAKTTSNQLGGLALAVPGTIIGGVGLVGIVAGIAEGSYALVGAILITPIVGISIFGAIKGFQILSRGKKFSSAKWKYTITGLSPKLK